MHLAQNKMIFATLKDYVFIPLRQIFKIDNPI